MGPAVLFSSWGLLLTIPSFSLGKCYQLLFSPSVCVLGVGWAVLDGLLAEKLNKAREGSVA